MPVSRHTDPPDFDPSRHREWRGEIDPKEYRNPDAIPEHIKIKVPGFEGSASSKNIRDLLIIIVLAASLSWTAYTNHEQDKQTTVEHKTLTQAQLAMETQIRIQNWLLSLSSDKRPQLMMPVEAWGLLTDDAKQKMRDQWDQEERRSRRGG